MNVIPDSTLFETLNAGLKPAAQSKSSELGQADFFELMIAQMKNQDPTKPMDGQEYLGQLAQFSIVNGIQGLQQSFSQLSQSLQSLHASSLVGRQVTIDGGSGYLAEGEPLQGSVNLADNVNGLTLVVSDASGRELRRLDLGPQFTGDVAFSWDGRDASGARLAPGVYDVRAEGRVGETVQGFGTRMRATVQSVSLGQGGQGMTLNLTGLGARDVGAVREIV